MDSTHKEHLFGINRGHQEHDNSTYQVLHDGNIIKKTYLLSKISILVLLNYSN